MLGVVFNDKKCFHGNDSMKEDEVENVLLKYLEGLGFNSIEFWGYHDKPVRAIRTEEETKRRKYDKVLTIYHWSRVYDENNKNQTKQTPTTLYGSDKFCPDSFYSPSGLGVPIITDGTTVAEYFSDSQSLFIFYDAIHTRIGGSRSNEPKKIFENIIDNFSDILSELSGKSKDEILKIRKEKEQEAKKQRMLSAISSITVKVIADLKSKHSNCVAMIEDYKSKLTKYVRDEKDIRDSIGSAEDKNAGLTAKFLKELDKVTQMAGIIDFDIVGNAYVFYTDMLYFYVGDARFRAGKYKITVGIENTAIRMYNLTEENRRKSYWGIGCQHPHVDVEGRPCLGNIAETAAILNANNEVAALATILKSYLEAVNIEDAAGKYYRNWDCVDEDGNTIEYKAGGNKHEYVECEDCGREGYIGDGELYICAKCGDITCCDCSSAVDGDNLCFPCLEDVARYCEQCNEYHYTENMYVCENCGAGVCGDHVTCVSVSGHAFCNNTCAEKHIENHPELYDDETDEEYDDAEDDEDEDVEEYEKDEGTPVVEFIPQGTIIELAPEETAETRTTEICTHCGAALLPEQLFTCEVCGSQGCSSCIVQVDDIYMCPTCRG